MHVHAPAANERTRRVLKWSLLATLAYIVLTVVAGIQARSLALLSEAGHNVSDFLALLLSSVAVYVQMRPPTSRKTFGYQRAGVLAAFVNALSLVALSFYLMYEAAHRLYAPQVVEADVMMLVAGAGVIMNAAIAYALFRTSRDVNIRSAFLHEIGDTLSTAAVIVGGYAIKVTGQNWIDPALSFGISALIIWSSLGIIRETLNILLEGAPSGIELARITEAVRAVEGVNDVHDLHVWSLGSHSHALSCHISIPDIPPSASERILREVQDVLDQKFHIHHTTIQMEHVVCDVAHGCVVPAHEPREHGHSHPH
jgi:cobalt-zinc-cadmium efflux system protein